MKVIQPFLILSVLLATGASYAGSCPLPGPEDRNARRALAREWFVKGEMSSKSNNDLGAIRAFQCSMSLIPHGFTAYNLAQVAERSGDLELAIMSYSQYLTLMPKASDKKEVEGTITKLKSRLEKVTLETVPITENPTNSLSPAPTAPLSLNPPPPQVKPGTENSQVPILATEMESNQSPSWSSHFGTAAWVTMGAGLVTLGAGVGCNLLARSKKSKSDELFFANDQSGADAAYADAKSYAYTSYGLFAAGAVATTLGITLGLWPKSSGKMDISFLSHGGIAFTFTGRYP